MIRELSEKIDTVLRNQALTFEIMPVRPPAPGRPWAEIWAAAAEEHAWRLAARNS